MQNNLRNYIFAGVLVLASVLYFTANLQDIIHLANVSTTSDSGGGSNEGYPVAPLAVNDLFVSDITDYSVRLSWTVPSDGKAVDYKIHKATFYITENNWNQTTYLGGIPSPAGAGETQTMDVYNLSSSTTYYFAMRIHDSLGNASDISNVIEVTTLAESTSGSGGSGSGQTWPDPNTVPDCYTYCLDNSLSNDCDSYCDYDYTTSTDYNDYSTTTSNYPDTYYNNYSTSTSDYSTTTYYQDNTTTTTNDYSTTTNYSTSTYITTSTTTTNETYVPPPSEEESVASISGSVTGYNWQPVRDMFVKVELSEQNIFFGDSTDLQGNYSVDLSSGGTYIVTVNPINGTNDTLMPEPIKVTLVEGSHIVQNIKFSELRKIIKGTVKKADGSKVEGAVISAERTSLNYVNAISDSSGAYLLRVTGGDWMTRVRPENPETDDWFYNKESTFVGFANDDTYEEKVVDFIVSSETVLSTKAGVSGIIKDHLGNVVKNIWVEVHNADFSLKNGASTDENGKYFINDLTPDKYSLRISLSPEYTNLIVPTPIAITLVEGQLLTKNISLKEAVKIVTGKVKYIDGTPVTDARVGAYKESTSGWADTLVDENGYYTLRVGSGSCMINVNPNNLETTDWSYGKPPTKIYFETDDTGEKEIINFIVTKANSVVAGKILNPDGSVPAPYTVWVNINSGTDSRGGEGGLDENGAFSIPIPEGTYTLNIFSEDKTLGIPKTEPFSAQAGETSDLGIIYLTKRNEHIKGKVVDENGNGIANVPVEAYIPGEHNFNRAITDSTGEYSLFVNQGTWMVTAMPDFTSKYISKEPSQKVHVDAGKTVYINFTLTVAEAVVSGVVKDLKGNILTDIYGWAFAEEKSDGVKTMSRPNLGGEIQRGSFSFNVPAGEYIINVHFPPDVSFSPGFPVPVSVGSGESKKISIKVRSNDAIIKGRLIDESGNVITGTMAHIFIAGEKGLYQEARVNTLTGQYVASLSAGSWYLDAHIDSDDYIVKSIQRDAVVVSSGQKVIKNIVLVKANSTISGKVKDSNGNPLPNVWVSADYRSFKEETPDEFADEHMKEEKQMHNFANGSETNTNGEFSIMVPEGTYYMHAFLPPEFGFINPEEQKIVVSSLGNINVDLVFRNRDSAISGNVYLNNNKTHAFVWAWSENGGFAETKADANGYYKIEVTKNDVWHIGAVKEVDNKAYKSGEIVIEIGNQLIVNKDLRLRDVDTVIPDSLSVITEADVARAVSVDEGASLSIPANTMAVSGNVVVTVEPEIELPSQGLSKVVWVGYNLETRDETGKAIQNFNNNVVVSIPYDEAQLSEAKVSVNDLAIGYWDESSGLWRTLDNSTVDKINKLVTASTNHFTYFAIISPSDSTPPDSPAGIIAFIQNNELIISWQNTDTDVDHVKIYRSTELGVLGEVIFDDIETTSQKDLTAEEGITYFYTVRAVDAAGNVSVNTEQVSATLEIEEETIVEEVIEKVIEDVSDVLDTPDEQNIQDSEWVVTGDEPVENENIEMVTTSETTDEDSEAQSGRPRKKENKKGLLDKLLDALQGFFEWLWSLIERIY